jgi:Pyridoxamine 5'-phosphate oxidase
MGHNTPDTTRMNEQRTTAQRVTDTLELLARNGDGWLATASSDGRAHLIAVSVCWTGTRGLIATRHDSVTAQNLAATGTARLALGTPDDAVLLDVEVGERRASGPGAGDLGTDFTTAMGWDPADEPGVWDYVVLTPRRAQAYRGYGERPGATVMRDGRWLA